VGPPVKQTKSRLNTKPAFLCHFRNFSGRPSVSPSFKHRNQLPDPLNSRKAVGALCLTGAALLARLKPGEQIFAHLLLFSRQILKAHALHGLLKNMNHVRYPDVIRAGHAVAAPAAELPAQGCHFPLQSVKLS